MHMYLCVYVGYMHTFALHLKNCCILFNPILSCMKYCVFIGQLIGVPYSPLAPIDVVLDSFLHQKSVGLSDFFVSHSKRWNSVSSCVILSFIDVIQGQQSLLLQSLTCIFKLGCLPWLLDSLSIAFQPGISIGV